jgi:hypothetical protein
MQHALKVERAPDRTSELLEHQARTDPMTAALRGASFEQGQDLLKPEDTLLGARLGRIDSRGVTIHALKAGPANTCVVVEGVHLGAGMEMMCWGRKSSGEVGDSTHWSATPVIVDLGFL